MSSWGQIFFSNSSSVNMFMIDSVHDWIILVLLMVISVVLTRYVALFSPGFMVNRFMTGHEALEVVWSVIPIALLGGLMGPSLSGLYCSDDISDPSMTLKVMGNQWFWRYEYPDFTLPAYSSYMVPELDLVSGFRNLETDNRVFLPFGVPVRVIVSSEDVAHSWAIPTLGVKVDAIPGRLNEISVFGAKCGVMYGQCSEICGSLHRFIPIKVEMLVPSEFSRFVR